MLINIRGTFGSGKSTIAREALGKSNLGQNPNRVLLAEQQVHSPTARDPQRVRSKQIRGTLGHFGQICALGTYREANPCGGVDEFSWKGAHDAICAAISASARMHKVTIFEGQVVSGIFQRYVDLAKVIHRDTGQVTEVVFIVPGVDECVRRVSARSGKPIDDSRMISSVFDKNRAVENCYEKMRSMVGDGVKFLSVEKFDSTDDARNHVLRRINEVIHG